MKSSNLKYVTLHNLTRPRPRRFVAQYCSSFFCRLRGLMFRRELPSEQGILLVQSRDSRADSSIHMLFMWMDIAVVWINNAGEVVDTCLARRWRPAYFSKSPARYVLEMSTQYLNDFQIGDKVRFEEAWVD